jgi:hypothetical protein
MFGLESCLFHYTSLEACTRYILPSLNLRASALEAVNDPRESKNWPFRFYARNPGTFDLGVFEAASQNLSQQSYILSLTRNGLIQDHHSPFDYGFGHSRLWAQYGDRHRGVCLAFDRDALHAAVMQAAGVRPVYCGDISYFDSPRSMRRTDDPFGIRYLEDIHARGIDAVLEAHIAQFSEQLLFTKHTDWQHEFEYRWIIRSSPREPIFIPIASAMRAIIVGDACAPEGIKEIIRLASPNNLAVHRMYWRGWTAILEANIHEFRDKSARNLNGIGFSTHIPCSSVFAQAHDTDGKPCAVEIQSTGHIIPLE